MTITSLLKVDSMKAIVIIGIVLMSTLVMESFEHIIIPNRKNEEADVLANPKQPLETVSEKRDNEMRIGGRGTTPLDVLFWRICLKFMILFVLIYFKTH